MTSAMAFPKPLSGVSSTNAITLEPQYATIGAENSVMLTTLYDDGTARHEIIDVEVDEKRKRDDNIGQQGRRVRFRDEETPTPSPPTVTRPVEAPFSAPTPPAAAPTPEGNPPNQAQKYRLVSEIGDAVPISTIGEKLMDTPVALTLREVFAASSEVSTYMHDQTRKRRMPIDPHLESMVMSTSAAPSFVPLIVTVNNTTLMPLYACPSGRANVLLDGHIKVNSLLPIPISSSCFGMKMLLQNY